MRLEKVEFEEQAWNQTELKILAAATIAMREEAALRMKKEALLAAMRKEDFDARFIEGPV